jgi:Class III cytochrome C family
MEQSFRIGRGEKDGFAGFVAVFLCVVISVFLVSTAGLIAAEEQEMPEEIYIDNKVYKTDRKGPVWFSHSEHADGYVEACDGCHHEYKDGKNIWEEGQPVKKCSACHDPSKSEGSVKKLNIAFHKNCKGCHRKLAKEGGTESPYKQCTDCHEKR